MTTLSVTPPHASPAVSDCRATAQCVDVLWRKFVAVFAVGLVFACVTPLINPVSHVLLMGAPLKVFQAVVVAIVVWVVATFLAWQWWSNKGCQYQPMDVLLLAPEVDADVAPTCVEWEDLAGLGLSHTAFARNLEAFSSRYGQPALHISTVSDPPSTQE